MFNYSEIDKTPTVHQVKAIIDYMENHETILFRFNNMMDMQRPKPNVVTLNLNNAHIGETFEITFNSQDNKINSFEKTGTWIS